MLLLRSHLSDTARAKRFLFQIFDSLPPVFTKVFLQFVFYSYNIADIISLSLNSLSYIFGVNVNPTCCRFSRCVNMFILSMSIHSVFIPMISCYSLPLFVQFSLVPALCCYSNSSLVAMRKVTKTED